MFEMTDAMKEVIANGASPDAIRQQMMADGQTTLQKDAIRLVAEGKTWLEEVSAHSIREVRKELRQRLDQTSQETNVSRSKVVFPYRRSEPIIGMRLAAMHTVLLVR